MNLSDSVTRKFIQSIEIDDWEIETDSGWEDISQAHQTIAYQEWVINTSDGLSLICADNHIVIDENFNEIFVKDLDVNQSIITVNGLSKISSIEQTEIYSNMYDFTVSSSNHRYFTNGILSHNTTTAVALILHFIIFNEYKEVGILANKESGAVEVLSRIKLAYEHLPHWLQQGIVEWNKKSIILENGCKIHTGATTSSSLRGKSLAFLYVDEAAFIEGFDEFFQSVYPTISAKTSKLLLTSTPNGLNHFHKIWTKSLRGENGYANTFVRWDMVPGRDQAWKEDALKGVNGDLNIFAQEYEGEFLGSSGTLISGSTLKALIESIPIHNDENLGLKTYEVPQEGNSYVCIVDVSRGKGLDYSAFHIINVTSIPYKQVATFRNNLINAFDYTEIIHRVSKSYNDAYILVETNDIGQQVADMLIDDFDVDSIFYTESSGRSGKQISAGFSKGAEKGVRTTKTVKNIGCSMIKTLVEQQQIQILDEDTIDEMKVFSKKGNSYQAEQGKNDDLMMGLVLFGWLTTQRFFKEVTDTNTLMNFKQRTAQDIIDDLTPFGLIYEDLDEDDGFVVQKPEMFVPGWARNS